MTKTVDDGTALVVILELVFAIQWQQMEGLLGWLETSLVLPKF
jgi:hypothetical protein